MSERINEIIKNNIPVFEMLGVMMLITSFILVFWLGPAYFVCAGGPGVCYCNGFMAVWIFNTVMATLLTYCSILKQDRAYILANAFWILVGVFGIARTGGWI